MANGPQIFSTYCRIGKQALVALDWEITLNRYSAADEAKVTLSLKDTLQKIGDLQALSQATIPLELQILGGFTKKPGSYDGLTVLFAGPVDCPDADWNAGTYEVTARSWAYQLLSEQTTMVFANQTTDQIARAIATKHGLDYDNGGQPSSTIAGKVYAQSQAKSKRRIKEWDLLVNLGQHDDREVYVIGKTLYYVPSNLDDDPAVSSNPQWTLWWLGENGQAPPENRKLEATEFAADTLKVAHYAQFSHDIKVAVINHDPATGAVTSLHYGAQDYANDAAKKKRGGHHATSRPPKRKPSRQLASFTAPSIGTKEVYQYNVHGYTPQQVADFAYARYKDITKHELVATATVDFCPAFGVRDVFAIQGTGTIADTHYKPKKIVLNCRAQGKKHALDAVLTLANHVPQPVGEVL